MAIHEIIQWIAAVGLIWYAWVKKTILGSSKFVSKAQSDGKPREFAMTCNCNIWHMGYMAPIP